MKLSKSNLFARYYNWIYGELPNDICSLFWGSVFAIGLSAFIVPGKLTSDSSNRGLGGFIAGGLLLWIFIFFFVAVGNTMIVKFGYEFIGFWGIFGLGLLFGIFVVAVVVIGVAGPIVGFLYLKDKTAETSTYERVKETTSDFVGAIRQKHCTKINWK